ncbi:mitochondrial ribosomal protein L37, putative [Babesia caballi]|uniref:Mitochondrial ribosomal protein L37, putative n=1 Tax=Babesia caballi TaxID=5871 RepID=A0AAV4M0C5_BABCB|nr:mitochondrial ribosomal protein L37, putative [Babesia caballi]
MLPDEAYPAWLWELDKPDKTYGELVQMFVYGRGIEDAKMRDYNRSSGSSKSKATCGTTEGHRKRRAQAKLALASHNDIQHTFKHVYCSLRLHNLEHLAHGNRLVLVAQREPAHLRAALEDVEAHGGQHLQLRRDQRVVLDEGRVRLLLLGGLVRRLEQLGELDLHNDAVRMHDAEVARGDERAVLQQVDDLDHGDELGDDGAGLLDVADDGALADLVLLEPDDAQPDVLSGLGEGELVVVKEDVLHLDLGLVGHDDAGLPRGHRARLDLAHADDAVVPVGARQRDAQRGLLFEGGVFDAVQQLEERGLRERVPRRLLRVALVGRLRDVVHQVLADQAGNGHEVEVAPLDEPAGLEEGPELLDDVVVPGLRPVAGVVVHLVDGDDEVGDAEGFGQQRVLTRLPSSLEPRLELSLARRQNEHTAVRLRGARDHVRHVVFVSWRVQDGEPLVGCFDPRLAHLHCLAFLPLLLIRVHNKSQEPALTVPVLRFSLVLLDGTLVHVPAEVQDVTTCGGLSRVDVTDEDNVQVLPGVWWWRPRVSRRALLLDGRLLGGCRLFYLFLWGLCDYGFRF